MWEPLVILKGKFLLLKWNSSKKLLAPAITVPSTWIIRWACENGYIFSKCLKKILKILYYKAERLLINNINFRFSISLHGHFKVFSFTVWLKGFTTTTTVRISLTGMSFNISFYLLYRLFFSLYINFFNFHSVL